MRFNITKGYGSQIHQANFVEKWARGFDKGVSIPLSFLKRGRSI